MPRSRTTRLLPPPTTATGSCSRSANISAWRMSSTSWGTTKMSAGPPMRSEVWKLSGSLIRGEVRFKEPLGFHTSLRIGGPADIFVVPQDVDDIRHALLFAEREQLSVAVIGGGNNLVVRDRGVRGVVLRLEGCLGRAEFHGEEAIVGAGVSLSALIREAAALNLGGIECLVGIPATLGGALAMNAGTPDGWIGDFVSAVYRSEEHTSELQSRYVISYA